MTIHFRITPGMFYGAQRAVMRHIRWMHLGGYFVVLLFPIIMVGISLAYGGTAIDALRNNIVMIVGFPMFWLVGIPLLTRWSATRTLRNTPAFQGELVYSFGEAGVDMQTDAVTSHLKWSTFTRAVETKEFVLLFQNKAMATFVPKVAFVSPGELQEFRELVTRQLGGRATWAKDVAVAAT